MMTIKVATWNVNSLRVRLPHVLTWLHDVQPDLLGLQEIKVTDAEFPFQAFYDAGYSVICSGQRTYNGVAIISRQVATDPVMAIPELDDTHRRVLAVTYDDIRIINIYVPNGESVASEKYQYKLRWLQHFDVYLRDELKKFPKLIVMGDFNIAPHDIDVHDPARWEGQVLFSQPERNAFQEMLQTGLFDCFRQIHPEEKKFTWWDYRLNAFRRQMGLRIDHILASETLAKQCLQCEIDIAPRSWERPSDHAPVIAEFK